MDLHVYRLHHLLSLRGCEPHDAWILDWRAEALKARSYGRGNLHHFAPV